MPNMDTIKSMELDKITVERPRERGLNKYTILVLFVATLGGLAFGLDIGTAAVQSMNSFRNATGIPPLEPNQPDSQETVDQLSLYMVLFHSMSLVGAPFAGQVSDRYGRKLVIILASSFFLAGSIWLCCAGTINPNFTWTSILLARVVGGFGNGFMLTIMPVYASELSPAKYRGQTITAFQLAIALGVFIMSVANNWLNNVSFGWRIAFGLEALPCIAIICLAFAFLPESPRYLLLIDKKEQARAALLLLAAGTPHAEEIVDLEIEQVQEEVTLIKQEEKKATFFDLFRKDGLAPFLCGFMIAFCQNITGVNWFLNYATTIFANLGYDIFLFDMLLKGVILVATIAAIFVIEKGGRKFLTLWGTIATVLIFTLITLVITATGVDVIDGSSSNEVDSVRLFTVIMIYVFQAVFATTWGPLGWVVPGEVFPLKLRSRGMGLCVVANMMTNIALGDYGFQAIKAATSLQFTTLVLVIANASIVLGTVVFLQPETKGVILEDMRYIFAFQPNGSMTRRTMTEFYIENSKQALCIVTCRGNNPDRQVCVAKEFEEQGLRVTLDDHSTIVQI